MALFKVYRGHPEDLDNVPLVDGHSYVCYSDDSDIATFWTDILDSNNVLRRIQIGGSGGGTDTEPLIATVESSSTSAHAYSTGDLLILNDNLYRATASIAIGATLAVGTNIAATTIADEIANLKTSIAAKYTKPSGGIPASDMAPGVIPSVPSASTSNPAMDGTASPGSSTDTTYAKGTHVHPTDTTRQAKITASGVLIGDGSGGVTAKTLDTSSLTDDNNHVPTSGVVKSAITNVESDLASIHATGTTNTTGATITAGTYFYLNGILVKAKTNIADGAAFTSGTNYEVPTAGALNALNSAFSPVSKTISYSDNIRTNVRQGCLYKVGKICILNFQFIGFSSSFSANTWIEICTLPADCSPDISVESTLGLCGVLCDFNGNPLGIARMYINGTEKKVYAKPDISVGTNHTISGVSCTFVTAT